jgi:hypothetical protein
MGFRAAGRRKLSPARVRALMALLNVVSEEPSHPRQIEQGVVYVFADGRLSRYS